MASLRVQAINMENPNIGLHGNPSKMGRQMMPLGNSSKMGMQSNTSQPRRILGDRTNVHGQKSVSFGQTSLKAGPSKKPQATILPSAKSQKSSGISKSTIKASNFKIYSDQPQVVQKPKAKASGSKTSKMPSEKEYMAPGDPKVREARMPAYLQKFVDSSPCYSVGGGMTVGPDLEIKPKLDLEIEEIPEIIQDISIDDLIEEMRLESGIDEEQLLNELESSFSLEALDRELLAAGLGPFEW